MADPSDTAVVVANESWDVHVVQFRRPDGEWRDFSHVTFETLEAATEFMSSLDGPAEKRIVRCVGRSVEQRVVLGDDGGVDLPAADLAVVGDVAPVATVDNVIRHEADPWAAADEVFMEALRYAMTQTGFIVAARDLSAERLNWIWACIQRGIERQSVASTDQRQSVAADSRAAAEAAAEAGPVFEIAGWTFRRRQGWPGEWESRWSSQTRFFVEDDVINSLLEQLAGANAAESDGSTIVADGWTFRRREGWPGEWESRYRAELSRFEPETDAVIVAILELLSERSSKIFGRPTGGS